MVIFILISSEIENADDELWIIKLTSNYPVWSSAYFRLNFYWLDYGYQYSGLWKTDWICQQCFYYYSKELQPDNAIIQGKAISSVGRNVEISTGKRGTDINTRRIPASNCLSARNAELKHNHTGARILWSYAFSIVATNRNKNLAGANIKRCDTV